MAHVDVRRKQRQVLQRLGGGGVVLPGSLVWNTYPQAALPALVSGAAGADADGTAVSFIAGGGITVPYWVTHLTHGQSGTANCLEVRYTVRQTATPANRRIVSTTSGTIAAFSGRTELLVRPLTVPASAALELLAATHAGGSGGLYTYCTIQQQSPVVPDPSLLRLAFSSPTVLLPTDALGTSVPSGAGAWTYSAYVQLTAGISTPILVTTVLVHDTAAEQAQVAFATGAGGAEIDWGVFGAPAQSNAGSVYRYDLLTPLLVPANLRLAARTRGSTGGIARTIALEYIALPLAVS